MNSQIAITLGHAPRESYLRRATGLAGNADLLPAEAHADTGADRLGECLLGGKARGVVLTPAENEAPAVGDLLGGEDLPLELFSILLEHPFDSGDLGEIDPGSDNHGSSYVCRKIWRSITLRLYSYQ